MRDEAYFNACMKNSLNQLPTMFAYKISDSGGEFGTIEKPYDLFGEFNNGFICIEGKKIKGLKAFNFNCFEKQQLPALIHAYNNNHVSLVSLYIYIPRKSFMLLFSSKLIWDLKQSGKKSILKKELEKLIDDYAIYIKKDLFDLNNYQDRIVKELID